MTEWHDIPGSKKYQISVVGEIRKKLKNGKFRKITSYRVKNKWLAVKVDINDVLKEMYVHKIMAITFNLSGKPGEVMHFVNGDICDPALTNLEFVDRHTLGKITGAMSGRKPVVKINADTDEIVEIYSSARECGKRNFCSYQTIMNRCNKKTKKAIIIGGYKYQWEENYKY